MHTAVEEWALDPIIFRVCRYVDLQRKIMIFAEMYMPYCFYASVNYGNENKL